MLDPKERGDKQISDEELEEAHKAWLAARRELDGETEQ
jgi:hypothetical protein